MEIVADISALLAGLEMNIHSMEVVQTGEHAMVYVEFETSRRKGSANTIIDHLSRIKGMERIRLVETLPYEERENRFKVLFDNMSDWVFSIDSDSRLKTINRIALKALDLDAARDIGRDIRELGLPDLDIIGCLNGQKYTDIKKSLITRGRRFRYLATGRPIRDAAGRIIGAMEISKGLSEIERMARSITESKDTSFSDIIGQSRAMIGAIDFAQKIAPTDAVVLLGVTAGPERSCLPALSITPAVAVDRSSRSIAPRCPSSCWKASSLATWTARLPTVVKVENGGCSNGPRREPFFWTKSPKCPWPPRPRFYVPCRIGMLEESAA